MPLEHWMMFGTFAEQDHFIYPSKGAYSGVIINANMATHAPGGLASFIIGKLGDTTKYLVDPMTHAFQHDPVYIRNQNGGIKSSVRSLAEAYGDPVADLTGEKSVCPLDFSRENCEPFVNSVLEFQRNHLHSYMKISDNAKYLEDHEIKHPACLIAPYFYLTETDWEPWLKLNIKLFNISHEIRMNDEKIWAEIVIDKGILLDEYIRRSINTTYSSLKGKAAGCIIWIDDFDEQSVSIAELRAFKSFCHELRKIFPELINLHGGYFSILMGGKEGPLTGVAHGPEFGEFRPVVPVGGGIPIAKFYIPRLHSRVKFREVLEIFSSANWLNSAKNFHENVCDCAECKETIDNNIANFVKFGAGEIKSVRRGKGMVRIEFPSSSTKIHCLRHYLQRKQREYDMIRSTNPETIIKEMASAIKDYQTYTGAGGIAHLVRWIKVLTEK